MGHSGDIRDLLEDVVALRKNVPPYAATIYEHINQTTLSYLNKVKFEIDDDHLLPDVGLHDILDVIDTNTKEINSKELERRLKRRIKLLQVLNKKKNCPISNIIDKI